MYKIKLIIVIFIGLLIWNGCSEKNFLEPHNEFERGDIVSTFEIGTYSPETIKNIFNEQGLIDTFELKYSVKISRVFYYTEDFHGNKILVSGALLNPITKNTVSLLSIHHGTQTKRDMVASQKPQEIPTGLTGLLTASKGFLTVIPDYPGFGVSEVLHPYLIADGIVPSIIDLLRASRIYCNQNDIILNHKLFLTGYSEGGYATLATLKAIEKEYTTEFTVTATAPLAGVFDLYDVAKTIISKDEFPWPFYLAYALTAYNQYYNWENLKEIFYSPYAEMMTKMFNGNYLDYEINERFPKQINEFIKPEFKKILIIGNESKFSNAFSKNNLLNWSPGSPLLFIHGDQDITAPYELAVKTVENLNKTTNSTIEFLTLKGHNHETAGFPAIVEMIKWFSKF